MTVRRQRTTLSPPVIKGLYALTPDTLGSATPDTVDLLRRAEQAIAGGVRVLQYRNKLADASLQQRQAQALREITRQHRVTFIVNDDAQLAAAVDADGVHLGRDDVGIAAARALLGDEKIIGVSCYNRLDMARQAAAAGADYVAFGAFFASSVKPQAVAASVEMLREARAELRVPIVAIGGITAENGRVLVEAGADALAVISAVFGAADVRQAAQDIAKLFNINK